jgi:hypothetical protein
MTEREVIFVVEEAGEGGYVASALGESIVTEADDLESLRAMVRDAVRCHFSEGSVPPVIRLHFVRDELIAV